MWKFLKSIVFIGTVLITTTLIETKAGEYAKEYWDISLLKNNLTCVEISPYGILVGQNSKQKEGNFYNGIYFSPDFGESWDKKGLKDRGINDIKTNENKIYAATENKQDGKPAGLYYSEDSGKTWKHLGRDVKANSLEIDSNYIYLGTENQGLWISNDNGKTWKNALTKGELQEDTIKRIHLEKDLVMIETSQGFWISTNKGETFTRRLNIWVKSAILGFFTIYAGTEKNGIITSNNYGETWKVLNKLNEVEVRYLKRNGNIIFAATKSIFEPYINLYYAKNPGGTWINTQLTEFEIDEIRDIATAKNITSSSVFMVSNRGIHKLKINNKLPKEPFLGKLWKEQKDTDLIGKITSFFDHEYPFLGYSLHNEPSNASDTTLNFLGQRAKEPTIYYSTHNGYDFALPYGTEVTAPADGIASYYYCPDCGYSIKIDHLNGYQTTYMHLQKDGLIASSHGQEQEVKEGDVIGKIGMTGRTTGPHLHFQIKRDLKGDGNFSYSFVDGILDPFGWKSQKIWDPWPLYRWEDIRGWHQGVESIYLWKEAWNTSEIIEVFKGNPVLLELSNISVEVSPDIKRYPLNLKLVKYGQAENKDMKYINNTAFLIEARDLAGNLIHDLENFVSLRVKLPNQLPKNILTDSLKLFHWNDKTSVWEPLDTYHNYAENTLEASTQTISLFAAFANTQKQDTYTQLKLYGTKAGDWYLEYPLVQMHNEYNDEIIYSMTGADWNTFEEPFHIDNEGVTALRYKDKTLDGREITRIKLIRVSTKGNPRKTLKYKGLRFTLK